MAVSDHGFVAQLPRGPQRSRYYLQCALGDGPEDWPDERLWNEIRLRLREPRIADVKVHDKVFVPLRSVVHAPMQYRNLFLAGDAAHLVPPASAKGMNLALYDVDVLAQAILRAVNERDRAALDAYSETCLPHIWRYQDFGCVDDGHDARRWRPHAERHVSSDDRARPSRHAVQLAFGGPPPQRAPAWHDLDVNRPRVVVALGWRSFDHRRGPCAARG